MRSSCDVYWNLRSFCFEKSALSASEPWLWLWSAYSSLLPSGTSRTGGKQRTCLYCHIVLYAY